MDDIQRAIDVMTKWSKSCKNHNAHIFELEDLELNEKTKEILDTAISAMQELQQYQELEEKLKSVYGECEGLLAVTVESLIQFNAIPEMPVKAILLTDKSAEEWEQYKAIGSIWENDIVEYEGKKGVVRFGEYDGKHYGFYIDWQQDDFLRKDILFWVDKVEVVGNGVDGYKDE